METREYEFNQSQNQLIKGLAEKMRFVSYILIAIGALLILSGIFGIRQGGLFGIINGAIQLAVGIWTNKAAIAFNQIVKTQGNDIENLTDALGELKKLYTLQYWLFIIGLAIIVIGLVTRILLPLFVR